MTFHISQSAKLGNKIVAVFIAFILVALLYVAVVTDMVTGLTRIWMILMVLAGGGWSFARSMQTSDPMLTINEDGVMMSGWKPNGHPYNWTSVLGWRDFCRATISKNGVRTSRLNFYHPIDKNYVIRTLENFQMFEQQEQIIQMIEEKTGYPVLTEKP